MAFVKVSGHVHHVTLRGPDDAPAVIFVNALGTDMRIWETVVDRLPSGVRTLRYDVRGHGLSGPAGAPMTIADYAADLASLMDHCAIASATIVGMSIGGMIALHLSQSHPDRVSALVLADTGCRIGTPDIWQARIEAVRDGGIEAIAEASMLRWFSDRFRQTEADAVVGWKAMLTSASREGYLAGCAALRDADLEAAARAVAVPTLCIVGSEDPVTSPDLVRALADRIPRCGFCLIEGAGHLPHLEAPQQFADVLTGFLAANSSAGDRYETGMAVRRAVLGNAHVDRAEASKTDFDRDFQAFIVEGAWGSLWARPGLTRRERSIVTLALLAAGLHHEEVAMHTRASLNTGASLNDIKEALLHVAVYAGVPAANSAFRIVKETMAKHQLAQDGGKPA